MTLLSGKGNTKSDANSYVETSTNTIGDPASVSNLPTNVYGCLLVFNCGAYITQIYIDGNNKFHIRSNFGAGWTGWSEK